MAKWETEQQHEMIKAEPDRTLDHFAGEKHLPDIFDEGHIITSPGQAFDLEDWDAHRELEEFDFEDSKKMRKAIAKGKLLPRYHQMGPDGRPIAIPQSQEEFEGQIHSATWGGDQQRGVIHSASQGPSVGTEPSASAGQPGLIDIGGPVHTAYATRGAMRTSED